MPRILRSLGDEFLSHYEPGSQEIGVALEDLVCSVMSTVPGVTITRRNQLDSFKSQEIDLAFWNEKVTEGLSFLPHIILVECKNWSSPVGSAEVAWFDRKVCDRGLNFGMLVCANGITGDKSDLTSARSFVADALKEGRRLLVLAVDEFLKLEHTDELIRLVKERLCELTVNRSCI